MIGWRTCTLLCCVAVLAWTTLPQFYSSNPLVPNKNTVPGRNTAKTGGTAPGSRHGAHGDPVTDCKNKCKRSKPSLWRVVKHFLWPAPTPSLSLAPTIVPDNSRPINNYVAKRVEPASKSSVLSVWHGVLMASLLVLVFKGKLLPQSVRVMFSWLLDSTVQQVQADSPVVTSISNESFATIPELHPTPVKADPETTGADYRAVVAVPSVSLEHKWSRRGPFAGGHLFGAMIGNLVQSARLAESSELVPALDRDLQFQSESITTCDQPFAPELSKITEESRSVLQQSARPDATLTPECRVDHTDLGSAVQGVPGWAPASVGAGAAPSMSAGTESQQSVCVSPVDVTICMPCHSRFMLHVHRAEHEAEEPTTQMSLALFRYLIGEKVDKAWRRAFNKVLREQEPLSGQCLFCEQLCAFPQNTGQMD